VAATALKVPTPMAQRDRLNVSISRAPARKGREDDSETTTQRHHQKRRLREEVRHLQAYTVEEVAEILHIGRDKVYFLLRTHQLRSIKIGKLRRITDQHLAEFIAAMEPKD
jgi:excisionase family DNA binding protein